MAVERAVRVRTSAGERSARMQDLSLTGCFLETSTAYEVGAILELRFALSSGEEQPLTTEARVVRRTKHGVGVRFVFSDAQTPLILKRWLSSAPPGRGDGGSAQYNPSGVYTTGTPTNSSSQASV